MCAVPYKLIYDDAKPSYTSILCGGCKHPADGTDVLFTPRGVIPAMSWHGGVNPEGSDIAGMGTYII